LLGPEPRADDRAFAWRRAHLAEFDAFDFRARDVETPLQPVSYLDVVRRNQDRTKRDSSRESQHPKGGEKIDGETAVSMATRPATRE